GTLDISDTVAETVNLTLTDSATTGLDVSSTQDVIFGVGGATKFVILDPTDGTVDNPITVTVQAQRADDSVDTSYEEDVTLAADGSATGGGVVDIVNGVGTIAISDTVPETVNLTLTDSETTGLDVSSTQDVIFGVGAATKFVILDPTDGTVDNPITVTVQAQDQFSNVVTSYGQNVTLNADGSSTGEGVVTIVSGEGTKDISDTVAETVNLTLTDSETTGLDVSSTQDVIFGVGAATKLLVVQQPSSTAVVDIAFTTQPTVEVTDQYGNRRTSDNSTDVTAADVLASDNGTGGSGTLGGTVTKKVSSGLATFTDLVYDTVEAIDLKFTSSPVFTETFSDQIDVTTAADTTAPGKISDLAVGTSTSSNDETAPDAVDDMATVDSHTRGFKFNWTVPYDDGTAQEGSASSYDVRFTDAVDYPSNITSSFPWGTNDLQAAKESTPGPPWKTVHLTWTAPGNDGSSGTATTYDIRYSSTGAINESNWSSATEVSGEPDPSIADSTENMIVTGLSASTQYWFAIKSGDEELNTSIISISLATETGSDTDTFNLSCAWNDPDNDTCSDTDGEDALWPNTLYYVAMKSTDDATNTSLISSPVLEAHTAMKHGYNFIGIPYDIKNGTSTFSTNFIDDVSSGKITAPVIYKWQPLGSDIDPGKRFNGRWTSVSATAALDTESNGTAFYILSWGSTDNVLDVDTGTVPEYGGVASEAWVGIILTKGRNLIGSPYLKNVNFSNIKICQDTEFSTTDGCDDSGGGTIKTFQNATGGAPAWVGGNIFHFQNSTTADYETCNGTGCVAELRPWWGHWISLLEDSTANTYIMAIPEP
ncbi:MAG: hypothetical protein ACYSTI_13450, partial [Planctomycetota bacterium]